MTEQDLIDIGIELHELVETALDGTETRMFTFNVDVVDQSLGKSTL